MAIELNPIIRIDNPGKINENFQKIVEEFQEVLRRDGVSFGEANQMEVDLDMNSQSITNAAEVYTNRIVLQGTDVGEALLNPKEAPRIISVTLQDGNRLRFSLSNGGSYTTSSLSLPQGPHIESVFLNDDNEFVLTLSDYSVIKSNPIDMPEAVKGERGEDAPTITDIYLDGNNQFVVSLSDGSSYTTGSLNLPDAIAGPPGTDGEDGTDGVNGRSAELRANATHVQWRLVGDVDWKDLAPKSEFGPSVQDVAAEVISQLGDRLLPAGGATDTALVKNSSDNYDVSWKVVEGSTGGGDEEPVINLPADITGLTVVSSTHDQIVLDWDGSAYADEYEVITEWLGGSSTITVTTSDATLTQLTPETAYTFTVSGFNADGEGGAATVTETTAAAPTAPEALTEVETTELTPNRITISWTAVADADEYVVELDNDSFTTTDTTYTFTGLEPATGYTVRVSAVNEVGTSESFATTITTAEIVEGDVPGEVKNVYVVEITTNSVVLAWDPVPNATSYYMNRGYGQDKTVTEPTGGMPYLTSGTTYNIQILARNEFGDGPVTTFQVKTPSSNPEPEPEVAPGDVTNLVMTARTYNSLSLDWDDTEDATSYLVDWEVGNSTTNSSDVQIVGLSPASQYTITVTPTNSVGDGGSATITLDTSDAPAEGASMGGPNDPLAPQPGDGTIGTVVPTGWPLVGVNLAMADFGPNNIYNKDYTYPKEREFERYSKEGVKLIRLPFKHKRVMNADGSWHVVKVESGGNVVDHPDGKRGIDFIKECLDYAELHGCKVVTDPHDYYKNSHKSSSQYQTQDLIDWLMALAAEIHDHPALIGFGLQNEPTGSSADWSVAAQHCIFALNDAFPNMTIVVPGNSYSSVTRWDDVNSFPLVGNNLVYEGHLYVDHDASGTWGNNSANHDRWQHVDPDQGVDMADNWVSWLQHYGLKGFIGETGVPWSNPSALTALNRLLSYLNARAIPFTYWGAGEWWIENDVNAIERKGVFKHQMGILRNYVDPNDIADGYTPPPIIWPINEDDPDYTGVPYDPPAAIPASTWDDRYPDPLVINLPWPADGGIEPEQPDQLPVPSDWDPVDGDNLIEAFYAEDLGNFQDGQLVLEWTGRKGNKAVLANGDGGQYWSGVTGGVPALQFTSDHYKTEQEFALDKEITVYAKFRANSTTDLNVMACIDNGMNDKNWRIELNEGNARAAGYQNGGKGIGATPIEAYSTSQWHVATLSRTQDHLMGFLDGGTGSDPASWYTDATDTMNVAEPLSIGARGNNSAHMNGYISELRIYQGAHDPATRASVIQDMGVAAVAPSFNDPSEGTPPPEETPDDLTGLSVTGVTTTKATVSWNVSANATSYTVDWGEGSTSTASTSYEITGLSDSSPYTITVTPVNDLGSGLSESVSITTEVPAPPAEQLPPPAGYAPVDEANLIEEWNAEDLANFEEDAYIPAWGGRKTNLIAEQEVEGSQPVYSTVEGKPSVYFSNDILRTVPVPVEDEFTVYAVANMNNTGSARMLVCQDVGSNGSRSWQFKHDPQVPGVAMVNFTAGGSSGESLRSDNAATLGVWHGFVGQRTSTQIKVWLDNYAEGEINSVPITSINSSADCEIAIGARGTNTEHFAGYIHSVRIYKGVHDGPTRAAVLEQMGVDSASINPGTEPDPEPTPPPDPSTFEEEMWDAADLSSYLNEGDPVDQWQGQWGLEFVKDSGTSSATFMEDYHGLPAVDFGLNEIKDVVMRCTNLPTGKNAVISILMRDEDTSSESELSEIIGRYDIATTQVQAAIVKSRQHTLKAKPVGHLEGYVKSNIEEFYWTPHRWKVLTMAINQVMEGSYLNLYENGEFAAQYELGGSLTGEGYEWPLADLLLGRQGKFAVSKIYLTENDPEAGGRAAFIDGITEKMFDGFVEPLAPWAPMDEPNLIEEWSADDFAATAEGTSLPSWTGRKAGLVATSNGTGPVKYVATWGGTTNLNERFDRSAVDFLNDSPQAMTTAAVSIPDEFTVYALVKYSPGDRNDPGSIISQTLGAVDPSGWSWSLNTDFDSTEFLHHYKDSAGGGSDEGYTAAGFMDLTFGAWTVVVGTVVWNGLNYDVYLQENKGSRQKVATVSSIRPRNIPITIGQGFNGTEMVNLEGNLRKIRIYGTPHDQSTSHSVVDDMLKLDI